MERATRILQHDLYQKELEFIVHAERDRSFCRHDMKHFLDVARIMRIMALERGLAIDPELFYAAGLLHDIGRGMEYRDKISHDAAGVFLARQIMPDCGFSVEETEQVCTAIGGHRMSEGKKESREAFSELLFQADHLSRECFNCPAEKECYWPKEKKNLEIRM